MAWLMYFVAFVMKPSSSRLLAMAFAALAIAMTENACSSGDRYSNYHDEIRASSTNRTSLANTTSTWNPAAAGVYLDQREKWWMRWNGAKRDNDTFCISCHTNLPFLIAQPELRKLPNESETSEDERQLMDNIKKRVRSWNSVESYYGEKDDSSGNGPGSRATEAVLNGVILSLYDSNTGSLTDDTRLAFKNMWGLQQTSGSQEGAWLWQKFRLSPWESSGSPYFGATLAALAVGVAPGNYRSSPEIETNLNSLRKYLDREYTDQTLLDRVGLLWASTKWPGLLPTERQRSIISDVYEQQQSDGGWSLSSLTWSSRYFGIPAFVTTRRRNDWTPQETKSDGLATGYIAFALEQAGVVRDDPHLKNALLWLIHNQNRSEGSWAAYSLNRKRDPTSDVGRFMSDAATAFALLALSEGPR